MTTTTGHLTWGVVFWFRLFVIGYLAKCGVVSGKLFVAYMYFVYTYMYDYDNWSSYLGCGLLV